MSKSKVSLIFIGTSKYVEFFDNWYKSIDKHFLNDCEKNFFVFTDKINDKTFLKPNVNIIKISHRPWPYITLMRFEYIKSIFEHKDFKKSDFLFYLDADLIIQNKITIKDILGDFKKDLIGVQHPGNFLDSNWNSFVKEGESSSNVLKNTGENNVSLKNKKYHQGCFWGGKKKKFIEMVNTCNDSVYSDLEKSIVADWHDESHMNCYFLNNYENLRTLSCEFAFPTHPNFYNKMIKSGLTPKILHIDKSHKEYPRFKGGKI